MWLAQNKDRSREHFDGFITAGDFQQIRDMGFDHVRVPFDYAVLEEDSHPFVYQNEGWDLLDRAVNEGARQGLAVILDLHRAPGFSFDDLERNSLFSSRVLQDRFVALWDAVSSRYSGCGPFLAYELLNEVVEPGPERWYSLAGRAYEAIRHRDPAKTVVVGGINYSGIAELDRPFPADANSVVHTFHFYEPLLVTHQKAFWNDLTRIYATAVPYPGAAPGLAVFAKDHPELQEALAGAFGPGGEPVWYDRAHLAEVLQPALRYRQRTGAIPYCGEWGVYGECSPASAAAWTRDLLELMEEAKIPWTWWNWKSDDFGIIDVQGQVRVPAVVGALASVLS